MCDRCVELHEQLVIERALNLFIRQDIEEVERTTEPYHIIEQKEKREAEKQKNLKEIKEIYSCKKYTIEWFEKQNRK